MAEAGNPFGLLGVAPRFDIDRDEVERAYFRAAAKVHPDRFTDAVERAEAEAKSAQLNRARAELADDEARANVLLRVLGGPSKEEEKTLPDGFLVEMLEVRERMEEAMAGGEAGKREELERWAAGRRRDHLHRLTELFAKTAGMVRDRDVLRDIRVELNAMRYIQRMIEQLDPGARARGS